MEFFTFLYSKSKIHTNMHKLLSDIFQYIVQKKNTFWSWFFFLITYFTCFPSFLFMTVAN